jgi:hypothetical protein
VSTRPIVKALLVTEYAIHARFTGSFEIRIGGSERIWLLDFRSSRIHDGFDVPALDLDERWETQRSASSCQKQRSAESDAVFHGTTLTREAGIV